MLERSMPSTRLAYLVKEDCTVTEEWKDKKHNGITLTGTTAKGKSTYQYLDTIKKPLSVSNIS